MNKILICDDDSGFAADLSCRIREALNQIGETARIHTYQNAEEIPDEMMNHCDIAFLDIDFANKPYTGVDIARKLRQSRHDAVIIFVTNFLEYAPEGYEVQAFRYLLKNEIPDKLKTYLSQAFEQLTQTAKRLQITVSGEIVHIPLEDILYLEAQYHTVVVHVAKAGEHKPVTYCCYSTLSKMEAQLGAEGFLRIHKSYLVNMRHLKRYMCKEATLSDGTVLSVSEKNYAEQKKQYLLWKGKQ